MGFMAWLTFTLQHKEHILFSYIWEGKQISTQYSSLPRCIFTINELAGAGYQEHELENCVVKKLYFKDTFRGLDSSYDDGFMKIIMQDEIVKEYG